MLKEKSESALRTIGEVADDLDLPQHVLRFWETKFREIEPVKRAGGRRYYRPRDVELLLAIRHLLYGKGYTIKGVQRILKEQGARAVVEGSLSDARSAAHTPHDEFETAGRGERGMEAPSSGRLAAEHPLFSAEAPPAPLIAPEADGQLNLSDEGRRRLARALEQIEECRRLLTLTRR